MLAQNLGDGKYQVGRRHAFAQATCHLKTNHVRRQKIHGLAQHRRLGLNAPTTPGHHADAVDHRRVTVGADQGVGVIHTLSRLVHAARKIFQIHLVHDAKARRYHTEGVKRLHAPFHEFVALAVALKLQLHVQVERILFAIVIDHHRVIDHQIDRHQRLNALGVFAQFHRDTSHRRQVGQQRHTGEVLQHHAGDHKRDLMRARRVRLPVCHLRDVLWRDAQAVAMAQDGLQHDAQRDGQALEVGELLG